MFQTLAFPSYSQSLPLSSKSNLLSISSSKREPRRPFSVSVRCRAAGCPVASRNSAPASLYEVLRVNHNASPADIKTAYRRLAKKYHPDAGLANSLDGSDFIQIHQAYQTLSDTSSRATYDRSMSFAGKRTPFSPSGRRPGFHPVRSWESDQCW